MDSREMYNATAHLSSLITWDEDWIHFGTEKEIKFDLLEKLIEEHLSGKDFLFIHGRTTSMQLKNEELIKTIRPFLGTDDFQLWNVTMDKVIRFNKIGVLHLGQRIKKDLEKSTDTAAFTTKFVLEDNKVITYVKHEIEDGAWQFFSDDEFEEFESVARIIGLNEIMDKDPTLKQLADMEPGYIATRNYKGDKWTIKRAE
jgi:hypothetical protein